MPNIRTKKGDATWAIQADASDRPADADRRLPQRAHLQTAIQEAQGMSHGQAGRHEPAVAEFVDDRVLEARTGIKRVTWQHYRARGEGPPFYRLNRRILYRWAEVVAWIEARRVGG